MNPPKYLNEHGRKIWREFEGKCDGRTLELLAHAYQLYREAETAISEKGVYLTANGGGLKLNPAFDLLKQASDQWHKYVKLVEKNLTPDKKDKLSKFIMKEETR